MSMYLKGVIICLVYFQYWLSSVVSGTYLNIFGDSSLTSLTLENGLLAHHGVITIFSYTEISSSLKRFDLMAINSMSIHATTDLPSLH